eukprot:GFUD01012821.1.p1 GENE.GFUD01012821.1~~GFUD01012821.1.p1  ORF type:complete len:241 (+),score=35.61 GFUD01012821.1:53-775(+)
MRSLIVISFIVLAASLLAEGKQRKKPKLLAGQGIEPCKKATSKRFLNYGYGWLLEAGIYELDGKTPVSKRKLGVEGLDLKIDQKYRIRAKFLVKKFSSFGSYPKYMGIKITENFTEADYGTQQAFLAVNKRPLIGVQECSQALKGSRGKDADGCKWVTEEYKDSCPITNKKDSEIEIDFEFLVPRLPNAVAETKFRIIGTEQQVDGRGCEGILNPGFPDPITTTSDLDMICFKYPTIFTR